ncbi:LysR family transcriptional regulator [Veronia pacifica]|uniref:LysR family transcriptional regulator n=1 Tax=Veronia pacifica TaxID=1080227 RepID=A0A1C3E9N4_9GAMM|nr:LysR family transcriptional regulator [Veronia pacifica]
MGQLENMQIFVSVVEAGSITKASEQLNLAKSAVSKRLLDTEQLLGVKLLNRTTRKSSLTEAGNLYYLKSKQVLEQVEEINFEVSSSKAQLKGSLKVSVPQSFGLSHLMPAIECFLSQHSELNIDLDFGDRVVDLVEHGIDVAVRIGHLKDSSLKAKIIAPVSHIICASPSYIEKQGMPTNIDALKKHCLLRYSQSTLCRLDLIDPEGKPVSVTMKSNHSANSGECLRDLAIAGHGVVNLPKFIVWQAIKNASLTPLMTDYTQPQMNIYVVYPQTRFLPQKVRHFIDYIAEFFGKHPYWEDC